MADGPQTPASRASATLSPGLWYRWSRVAMVGLLLMLQLYFVASHRNVHVPQSSASPPLRHKHSPQAAIKPLIDEFLDENSPLRHLFFPDSKSAIHPANGSHYYRPGHIWLDTQGNPIQAHGGGVLYDETSHTYYWYGEYRQVGVIGVGCYSSKDLWTWQNQGIVLSAQQINNETHKSNMLERPKVIYNDKTGKYVMWMHVDDVHYRKAAVGIAISDRPTGPFQYLGSRRPHGFDSRDMTTFKDDNGVAYIIYSSKMNTELHIGPLTEDYLDVQPNMRRILVGQRREAPAVFKYQGTYYMITSACTGWAPNEAKVDAAESIMGPWETIGDPCIGGKEMFRLTTFLSQSTFVLPLLGLPGSYIFMADRWNPAELNDSRYVWLPLAIGGRSLESNSSGSQSPWPRVSIHWHKKWRLPLSWRL
ncbi:hypothetical protein Gotri_004606 [Gossypium trilobum]|uniref:Uncharacterized protein n=1 Tax=Gossypium trilobum TaxID=34281 RepID=A0A7J9F5D8_9ROSI|nr:hypothetical protein [Gossypium trilobum]